MRRDPVRKAIEVDPLLAALVDAARARRSTREMIAEEEEAFVEDEAPARPVRLAAADHAVAREWSAPGLRVRWEPGRWTMTEGETGWVLVTAAGRVVLVPGEAVPGPDQAPAAVFAEDRLGRVVVLDQD